MSNHRPNPDELLRQINKLEEQTSKGKLKIFFGYAAGVGKTYAMLDAAHLALEEGVDVVIGYVEPHTRAETLKLVDGLEQLATFDIVHKGITIHEFNLDEALRRSPALILVDELAHTNAVECRHRKRYQDIEELLNAGIDVYTTVNVQHLESLNDIVASITGVFVRERIPDYIFDEASQVKLIDIEPNDLIERLSKGKIYQKNKVKHALSHFFTFENLVALREIALRRTADRVNKEVINSKGMSSNDYFTGEHVLVCLGPSPSNAKVIRTASRMADAFNAKFTALYVKTSTNLSKESFERLNFNTKLAEDLGGNIITVYGDNIARQITEYVKVSGVSKIVLGRPKRSVFQIPSKMPLVEQLISLAPHLDVYVIPDQQNMKKERSFKALEYDRNQFSKEEWIKTIVILGLVMVVGFIFEWFGLRESNIMMIFILGVLMISIKTSGRLYGIVSSILSVLVFNFFFTEPRFTLAAYGAEYPITFAVMLATALMASTLTTTIKNQARVAVVNAHSHQIMLETSRFLQTATTSQEIIECSLAQLEKLLNKPIVFYWGGENQLSRPHVLKHHLQLLHEKHTNADEQAVATWVYKNNKRAGAKTDTLPSSSLLYLPVSDDGQSLAVIGIVLSEEERIESFQQALLYAMVNQVAFAMKKYLLARQQQNTVVQIEKEKLKINLLRALSHDLKSPLTTIYWDSKKLLQQGDGLDIKLKETMTEEVHDQSIWLINLVDSFLSVAQLEHGEITLEYKKVYLKVLIEDALRYLNGRLQHHTVLVDLEDESLLIKVDQKLMVQVFVNIIDNALKYSPVGSTIIIRGYKRRNGYVVEIIDQGKGMSDKEKLKLFDMFSAQPKEEGKTIELGLGLLLCKTIIEAHGGEIYVKDNRPNGTIIGWYLTDRS